MITTKDVLKLAAKHKAKGNMSSSACVALSDAEGLMERGFTEKARQRAIKSLAYSVGILHADYKRAASREGTHPIQ